MGMGLAEALESWKDRFPAFFLPVLRCGEESGRVDQTLEFLECHCRLLAGPARTMRNTWFVPLCLMFGGTGICAVAYLALAPIAIAMGYILDSLTFYGAIAGVVWAAFHVPRLRRIVDHLRLAIPVIGPAERELTMNRFFHAMNLLYSTGGRRVEQMIRLAAHSAENLALRDDFLGAARAIESGRTIGEAFSALDPAPLRLPDDHPCWRRGGKTRIGLRHGLPCERRIGPISPGRLPAGVLSRGCHGSDRFRNGDALHAFLFEEIKMREVSAFRRLDSCASNTLV